MEQMSSIRDQQESLAKLHFEIGARQDPSAPLSEEGKGPFPNYVVKILAFFDHLPPCVDIFYRINADKKWTFLDHLPTLSCNRIL